MTEVYTGAKDMDRFTLELWSSKRRITGPRRTESKPGGTLCAKV